MKKNYIKISAAAIIIIGSAMVSNAQIVGGVSYLKGKFVEVAISDCGTYTSAAEGVVVAAPTGYHENTIDGSLSFGNDVNVDGWDLGVPDQCGDYIMPGSPEDGFAIQMGTGTVYGNIQPYCYSPTLGTPNLPSFEGGNTFNANGGATRKSIWQGTNTDLGLAIAQTSYFLNKKQAILTIVDICNGGDELYDVYYARNADPDNDQVTTGDFTTKNNVVKQYATGGFSYVSAASNVGSPCFMSYVTGDARGKVSRGNFSMGSPYDMYNGLSGYVTTSGANSADEAIQVSFKIDTIAHNDCACVAYSTVFTSAGVTEQVALTNTACATLGTLARFGEDVVAEYLDNPTYFLNNQMLVYPNPSNGNFTLNLFEIENATITVVSITGQVVYTETGVSNIAGITLENLTPGLYLVNAEYADGKKITKSVVIE